MGAVKGKGSWHPVCRRGSRWPLSSRPFLDMVYHALDSPDDDYHALFVLCLLYAMSHNKGEPLSSSAFRGKDSCFP